jgi:hypothetical protein
MAPFSASRSARALAIASCSRSASITCMCACTSGRAAPFGCAVCCAMTCAAQSRTTRASGTRTRAGSPTLC